MKETKRIYTEEDNQVYNQRRHEIERFGYEKAFGVVSFEKYEWLKNNNMLGGNFNED